jgi:hypothetical protein
MTDDDRDVLIEHLRFVILAAADDIESWGAYAGEYFQEKWDLSGDIKLYRELATKPSLKLIERFHEPSRGDPPHCLVDGQAHPCAAVRLARRTGGKL